MRTREYAELVGVSEQCVRQWIDRQLIPVRPLIEHGRLCYDIDPDTPRPEKITRRPYWLDGKRTGRPGKLPHVYHRRKAAPVASVRSADQLPGQIDIYDYDLKEPLSKEEFLKLAGDDVPPWL